MKQKRLETTVVEMTSRGVVTIPKRLRTAVTHFEVVARPDGVIELHPQHLVAADQAWFWSERWQNMERVASAEIDGGRTQRSASVEDLFEELDAN